MSERARNHCKSGGARSNRLCDRGRVDCGSGMSVLLCDREVAVRDDGGESRIVDGGIYSLEGDARAEARLERAEEGLVRLRGPERPAPTVRPRGPTHRRHHRTGTACAME